MHPGLDKAAAAKLMPARPACGTKPPVLSQKVEWRGVTMALDYTSSPAPRDGVTLAGAAVCAERIDPDRTSGWCPAC